MQTWHFTKFGHHFFGSRRKTLLKLNISKMLRSVRLTAVDLQAFLGGLTSRWHLGTWKLQVFVNIACIQLMNLALPLVVGNWPLWWNDHPRYESSLKRIFLSNEVKCMEQHAPTSKIVQNWMLTTHSQQTTNLLETRFPKITGSTPDLQSDSTSSWAWWCERFWRFDREMFQGKVRRKMLDGQMVSNGIKWSVHHVHLWWIGLQLRTHFRFLDPSSFPSVCLLCELLGLLLVPHLAFVEHASKFSQTTGAMRSKKRPMALILEIDCPTLPWQKAVLLEALPRLPLAKNTNMLEKNSSAICRRGVPITISFGSRALWARASYAGHGVKTLQQISIADLVHSTYENVTICTQHSDLTQPRKTTQTFKSYTGFAPKSKLRIMDKNIRRHLPKTPKQYKWQEIGFLFGSAWNCFLDLLLQLSQLLLHLDNKSIKINEQKRTIWLQKKKRPKCKNLPKSPNFECKFDEVCIFCAFWACCSRSSWASKAERKCPTTLFAASACQHVKHVSPRPQQPTIHLFLSSTGHMERLSGKNGKSEGRELYGIKVFRFGWSSGLQGLQV